MRNKKIICTSIILSIFLIIPAATDYAIKTENIDNAQTPIDRPTIRWPDKNDKYPIIYILPPQNKLDLAITTPSPSEPIDNMPFVNTLSTK